MQITKTLRGGVHYLAFLRKLGFSRLILSAGMPRSGSTLLFNILRIALSERNERLVSGWIDDLRELPDGDTYLVKVHHVGWHRALRAQGIFYSYRDIRDALVSNQRKFGRASIDLVDAWIRDYEFARRHATRMVRYEDMMDSLPAVVEAILGDLDSTSSVEGVIEKLPDRDSSGRDGGYSKESLLHAEHRTYTSQGEWREVLDEELRDKIHARYSWWLEMNGYPI